MYRFDDQFREVDDEESYQQFVEGKLRFLPCNVVTEIRRVAELNTDFLAACRQRTLPAEFLDPQQTSQRALAFFRCHRYFENALVENRLATDTEIGGAQNYLEIQFVRKVLAPLLNEAGMRAVQPQLDVGPYSVDFALEGATKVALEVDGFGKFKTRQDLSEFTRRQNYIANRGWRVIRYTYGQVIEATAVTLREMHTLLAADPQLRHFLHGTSQTDLFSATQSFESDRSPIDLVNDFYRVQDCFVDSVLSEVNPTDSYVIRDGFDLDCPFVALAVSSLYEFLDAVAEVLAVDFDLPRVVVCGDELPSDRTVTLHRLVSGSDTDTLNARTFDGPTARQHAFSAPTPPRSAGQVDFRRDLSLDEIHRRLEYFTRNVFGYIAGTKRFQNRVLKRIFDGKSVLGISATGSGKSFCFWLPSLLKPGLTLVICPLRSLMRDQHLTLLNYGIASAEFINFDVDRMTQRRILEEARLGYVRLLYISPERLRIRKFLDELDRLKEFVPINFLAVDEAHCISEWGHDFRPSYLKLPFLQQTLGEGDSDLQLIAVTATAGPKVEEDMLGILKFRSGDSGDVVRDRDADRKRFSYQFVAVNDGSKKTATYHEVLTKDLPRALKQASLESVVQMANQRSEKAVGIVFCIYADPHGRHSSREGIAHYLYETMGILEPDARFVPGRRRARKLSLDAYSTGRIRAFASKMPTLCPKCHSYQYTSAANANNNDADEVAEEDDAGQAPARAPGQKLCICGHTFAADDAQTFTDNKWRKILQKNQNDFKKGGFDILVATKGFGMGIDKSSVRFIVHTSMSSGLESWYQEVGRAGRDDERAHIVLLVDPPNESCFKDLMAKRNEIPFVPRPSCNYRSGCHFGKEGLCDYGKQHMFISRSYPGPESDAVSALRMLDKLIVAKQASADGTVVVNSSNSYLAQNELALYRLTVLGWVDDYAVTYTGQPNPRFDVAVPISASPDQPGDLSSLRMKMRGRLAEHLSHFANRRGRTIAKELERCRQEYRPLQTFSAKLNDFATYIRCAALFEESYECLLLLMDHTYKDVVRMRYDMLWNLLDVVRSKGCRRLPILQYFGDSPEESYQCGSCDVCTPNLDFPDIRNAPAKASNAEKELLLEKILASGSFDLQVLRGFVIDFADYPTAKYRQARNALEKDANNLPALFLAREFSPPVELRGNARRLLRTANEMAVELQAVEDLYRTSPKQLMPDLLLDLNEASTACDSPKGWRFLVEESGKPEHRHNDHLALMGECLEFFLMVDSNLSDQAHSLSGKVSELERVFDA